MGAWGPGLFSDDLALDVRGDYRELIEDGVDDEEAGRRILEKYVESSDDPDEGPTFWLALAFTQSKLGRLDSRVKDRALAIIERGEGLHVWEDDPKLLAKRKVVLGKVKAQLTGPQPPCRKLRPPSRHVTDLVAGDVLLFRTGERCALLRVARIEDHRLSVAPILVALDYDGAEPPSVERINQLPDQPEARPAIRFTPSPWATTRWRPMVFKRVDYRNAGFVRLGRIERRPGDETLQPQSYGWWAALAEELTRFLKSA